MWKIICLPQQNLDLNTEPDFRNTFFFLVIYVQRNQRNEKDQIGTLRLLISLSFAARSLLFLSVPCLVTQSCPTLCDPMDFQPARLLCPWGFSRQEYWSGLTCPPPGDLPNPGIEARSPTLQVDSLPAEPQGKSKSI